MESSSLSPLSITNHSVTTPDNNDNGTAATDPDPDPLQYTLLYHISTYTVYVGLPVIILLGNFGNVMTIVIMRRMMASSPSARSVVNIFFTAIASVDLLVLYVHALDFWVGKVTRIFARAQSTASCKALYWLYAVSATSSCWLLVCMTVTRATSVVWPHRVNVLCTRRTVYALVAAIVLFCSAFYSHYAVGMDMSDLDNDTYHMCWTKSEEYHWFIQNVFVYMDLSVYCLLPFTCLVVSNTVLVWKLTSSIKTARADLNLTSKDSEQVRARERAANSVTLTVVVVSLTFMVLILPMSVYFMVFNNADLQSQYDWDDRLNIEAFFNLSSVFQSANSAVNFYLYCLTGRRFREEFVSIVRCGGGGGGGGSGRDRRRPGGSSSVEGGVSEQSARPSQVPAATTTSLAN